MFKQFFEAIKAYPTAFNIIIRHNLWIYFLFPIVLFILLLVGGSALIFELSDYFQSLIISLIGLPGESNEKHTFLTGLLSFFINIGLKFLFFFILASIQKYIILILLSPVLSLLSEKTDEIITGKKYAFQFKQLLKDSMRGSLVAFRNMILQFALIICCFALMLVPVLGWFAPFFLVIINYYFYGFSMLDYTSERYRMSVSESTGFIRKNKGLAIGNGFIFALLFAIPYAGVVFAPILGVVAATIVAIEAHPKNVQISNEKN
jgi:CysZ protein